MLSKLLTLKTGDRPLRLMFVLLKLFLPSFLFSQVNSLNELTQLQQQLTDAKSESDNTLTSASSYENLIVSVDTLVKPLSSSSSSGAGTISATNPFSRIDSAVTCVKNGIASMRPVLDLAKSLSPFAGAADGASNDLNTTLDSVDSLSPTNSNSVLSTLKSGAAAFDTVLSTAKTKLQVFSLEVDKVGKKLKSSGEMLGGLEGMVDFVRVLSGAVGRENFIRSVLTGAVADFNSKSAVVVGDIAGEIAAIVGVNNLLTNTPGLSLSPTQISAIATAFQTNLQSEILGLPSPLLPENLLETASNTGTLHDATTFVQKRILSTMDDIGDLYRISAKDSGSGTNVGSLNNAAEQLLIKFIERASGPAVDAVVQTLAEAVASRLDFSNISSADSTGRRLTGTAYDAYLGAFRSAFAGELAKNARASKEYSDAKNLLISRKGDLAKDLMSRLRGSAATLRRQLKMEQGEAREGADEEDHFIPERLLSSNLKSSQTNQPVTVQSSQRRLLSPTTLIMNLFQFLSGSIMFLLSNFNRLLMILIINSGFALSLLPAAVKVVSGNVELTPSGMLQAISYKAGCPSTDALTNSPMTSCSGLSNLQIIVNGTLHDIGSAIGGSRELSSFSAELSSSSRERKERELSSSIDLLSTSSTAAASIRTTLMQIPAETLIRVITTVVTNETLLKSFTDTCKAAADNAIKGLFGNAIVRAVSSVLKEIGRRLSESGYALVQRALRKALLSGAISNEMAWTIARNGAEVYNGFGDAKRWAVVFTTRVSNLLMENIGEAFGRADVESRRLSEGNDGDGTNNTIENFPLSKLDPNLSQLLSALKSSFTTLKSTVQTASNALNIGGKTIVNAANSAVDVLAGRMSSVCNATEIAQTLVSRFKTEFYDKDFCVGLTSDDDYCVGGQQKCVSIPLLGSICQTMPRVCVVEDILQRNMTFCRAPKDFFSASSSRMIRRSLSGPNDHEQIGEMSEEGFSRLLQSSNSFSFEICATIDDRCLSGFPGASYFCFSSLGIPTGRHCLSSNRLLNATESAFDNFVRSISNGDLSLNKFSLSVPTSISISDINTALNGLRAGQLPSVSSDFLNSLPSFEMPKGLKFFGALGFALLPWTGWWMPRFILKARDLTQRVKGTVNLVMGAVEGVNFEDMGFRNGLALSYAQAIGVPESWVEVEEIVVETGRRERVLFSEGVRDDDRRRLSDTGNSVSVSFVTFVKDDSLISEEEVVAQASSTEGGDGNNENNIVNSMSANLANNLATSMTEAGSNFTAPTMSVASVENPVLLITTTTSTTTMTTLSDTAGGVSSTGSNGNDNGSGGNGVDLNSNSTGTDGADGEVETVIEHSVDVSGSFEFSVDVSTLSSETKQVLGDVLNATMLVSLCKGFVPSVYVEEGKCPGEPRETNLKSVYECELDPLLLGRRELVGRRERRLTGSKEERKIGRSLTAAALKTTGSLAVVGFTDSNAATATKTQVSQSASTQAQSSSSGTSAIGGVSSSLASVLAAELDRRAADLGDNLLSDLKQAAANVTMELEVKAQTKTRPRREGEGGFGNNGVNGGGSGAGVNGNGSRSESKSSGDDHPEGVLIALFVAIGLLLVCTAMCFVGFKMLRKRGGSGEIAPTLTPVEDFSDKGARDSALESGGM